MKMAPMLAPLNLLEDCFVALLGYHPTSNNSTSNQKRMLLTSDGTNICAWSDSHVAPLGLLPSSALPNSTPQGPTTRQAAKERIMMAQILAPLNQEINSRTLVQQNALNTAMVVEESTDST
jgi:hypothetical protein